VQAAQRPQGEHGPDDDQHAEERAEAAEGDRPDAGLPFHLLELEGDADGRGLEAGEPGVDLREQVVLGERQPLQGRIALTGLGLAGKGQLEEGLVLAVFPQDSLELAVDLLDHSAAARRDGQLAELGDGLLEEPHADAAVVVDERRRQGGAAVQLIDHPALPRIQLRDSE
jgi:hypothetical protein